MDKIVRIKHKLDKIYNVPLVQSVEYMTSKGKFSEVGIMGLRVQVSQGIVVRPDLKRFEREISR